MSYRILKAIFITGTTALLFCLGCAPKSMLLFPSKTPSRHKSSSLSAYSVYIAPLENNNQIPLSFSSHASFKELRVKGSISKQIYSSIKSHIESTGLFKKVLEHPEEADLVIKPVIDNITWEDSGSFWTTVLYTTGTLGIYPLAGGALSWPVGEVKLKINLSSSLGDMYKTYETAKKVDESFSLYSFEKATPARQLSLALNMCLEDLGNSIYSDQSEIVTFLAKSKKTLAKNEVNSGDIGKDTHKANKHLELNIVKPLDNDSIPYASCWLEISFNSSSILSEMEVSVNNKIIEFPFNMKAASSSSRLIRLIDGVNSVKVTAINKMGVKTEEKISFTHLKPQLKEVTRWILYVLPEEIDLSQDFFQKDCYGLDITRSKVISGKKANRNELLSTLRKSLRFAKDTDEVIIFYLGGYNDNKNLLTFNDDKGDNGIDLDSLSNALKFYLSCKNISFILFLNNRSLQTSDLKTIQNKLDQNSKYNLIVAKPSATAKELEQKKVCELVTQALSAEADNNKNAIITLKEFVENLQKNKNILNNNILAKLTQNGKEAMALVKEEPRDK